MNVSEIKSSEWSISLAGGAGVVVQGIDDINQCIDIIIRTIPGTDPFRPLFGSNVYSWTDKPINDAIPNIRKEIINAIGLWEPRVSVTSVTHVMVDNSTVKFSIQYQIINSVQTDQTDFIYGLT